ncbi:MAG TPA: ScyD/ScyE family protein [Chloroflexota bacterium]|nr:ScyD/ScyE family protein [Chloroflexota bacterium]
MRLAWPPFRLTVYLIVIVSFTVLLLRSRPLRGTEGVEPLLFLDGLHQPRGLVAAPDGTLFVAEAGRAAAGEPATPGRVSHVTARNQSTVVLDGLAAASESQPLFAQSGPAALALPTSAGAGTAAPGASRPLLFLGASDAAPLGTVARMVQTDDSWSLTATTAIGATGERPASGPATAWGAQAAADGSVYVAMPLANLLLRLPPGAEGMPAAEAARAVTGFIGAGGSNPLPVGVALAPDGSVLVAHFGAAPFRPGGGRIVQVEADGRWQPRVEGLSFPVALAFGRDGQLYVLEFASGYDQASGRFTPRSGRLISVGPQPGRRRIIVRDVHYPTSLVISAGGDAYFTENGVFSAPGQGRILMVPAPTLRGS